MYFLVLCNLLFTPSIIAREMKMQKRSRFNIQNLERNCMKMEFPREMQLLMEKIKANGFKQIQ